jgi:hypothetical protein
MNMKWIWNEYEMTWSPISTRWNTTQICLVFPSFMPLSALLVDQPKLLNTVQHLCDVLIQLTGPPRGEVCQSFRCGFEKCGAMWWLQVVVRVLLEPAMLWCVVHLFADVPPWNLPNPNNSNTQSSRSRDLLGFWTLFLAVFDADFLVPLQWGPAQEWNLNKPLVKVDGGQ